ncbi:MAG: MoaF N-terminal domain-containing protein [Gemmatimonadales bacterium]
MTDIPRSPAIRGTMRWRWTAGPTAGMVHEHVFHDDGTVDWHDAGARAAPVSEAERVPFAAFEVTPSIHLVSYLAKRSGFTLTVVLDTTTARIVGIASSSDQWYPVEGTFEVVA